MTWYINYTITYIAITYIDVQNLFKKKIILTAFKNTVRGFNKYMQRFAWYPNTLKHINIL